MTKNDQEFLVQKIRTQYTEKEHTDLDELRKLDSRVRKPANIFAYVFGVIGAVVLGSGMSLVMTDIGETAGIAEPMAAGIVIGILGRLMVIVNYPIYKNMLASRRKKYANQVLAMSDKIMRG